MRDLLGQIGALEAELAGDADIPRGPLRVSASIDFGQRFVVPWLLDFRARNEGVSVELSLSSGYVDLTATGTDVALRVGEQADSALIARKIATVPRVMVAAPSYLARKGYPAHPDDLGAHDFVLFHRDNRNRPLVLHGPDGARHEVRRSGSVTIDAVTGAVEATRRGFGIHVGPAWAFQPLLDSGDVVEVLHGYRHPAAPMHVVRRAAVAVPAAIRAVVAYLATRVREVPGLLPP